MSGDNLVRLRPAVVADGARIGAGLAKLGNHVARNINGALAIVLVIDGDDVPSMWAFGRNPNGLTVRDLGHYLHRGAYVVNEWRKDGPTLNELMHDDHARRLASRAAIAARQAEKDSATPWVCEHCNKRFKTQRGAERHESGCTRQPRNADHQWSGSHRTPEGVVHRCRCGWATGPSSKGWNWSPELRSHFNTHTADQPVAEIREVTA